MTAAPNIKSPTRLDFAKAHWLTLKCLFEAVAAKILLSRGDSPVPGLLKEAAL